MFIFKLLFLFMIGATFGWIIELFYRRFVSVKHWINPGFLVGPALPLYGFGIVFLYLVALLGENIPIENIVLKKAIIILLLGFMMTLVEYIAGLIFIKGMHIKLWDYSKEFDNIQGIICPLFSLIWLLIAGLYYLFLNDYIVMFVDSALTDPIVLFFIGLYFGIFIIDLCISFNVSTKIRKLAKEAKIIVVYEEFKKAISEKSFELKEKVHFVLPFVTGKSLKEHFKNYISKLKKNKDETNIEDDK